MARVRPDWLTPLIAGLLVGGITWLISSPSIHVGPEVIVGSPPSVVGGTPSFACIHSKNLDNTVEAGEVVVIAAEVHLDSCQDPGQALASTPDDSVPYKQGNRAQLALVSPLFSGDIKPISAESVIVQSSEGVRFWSWEVRPNEPGDYHLSIVLEILADDGKTVVDQSKRLDIAVHSQGHFEYYVASAGRGIKDFVTSAQTVSVAGAATAGIVSAGLVRIRQRRRSDDTDEPTDSNGNQGYM